MSVVHASRIHEHNSGKVRELVKRRAYVFEVNKFDIILLYTWIFKVRISI